MAALLEHFDNLCLNYGEYDAVFSSDSGWCFAEIKHASDALSAQLVYRFGRPDILLMDLDKAAAAELAVVVSCMRLGILFCPVDGSDPMRLKQIVQVLRRGRQTTDVSPNETTCPKLVAAVLAANDEDPRLASFYHAGIHCCLLLNEAGDLVEPMSVPLVWQVKEELRSDDLYILFTSGTTSGEPRAVVGSQKQTIRRLKWFMDDIHLKDECVTVIARRAPLVFVDGVHELLSVLFHDSPPAKIYCGKQLPDFAQNATRISLLPSQLLQLIESSQVLKTTSKQNRSPLNTVIVSGELCPPVLVRRFLEHPLFENTRLFNFYGQTETVGDICYSNLAKDAILSDVVPVGRPLPGVVIEVAQGSNHVVVMEGSFANGFFNSTECLAPFATGDIGFWNGDCLYVRGRIGDMQKVNGTLTSTADVEQRFKTVFGESPCAAIFHKGSIYILTEKPGLLNPRERMRDAQVPWSQIPKRVFHFHSLPVTASGKLNRRKVKEIILDRLEGGSDLSGHSPLIQAVCGVLGISSQVLESSPNLSFVELGGDSHLAVAVWHKLRSLEMLGESTTLEPLDLLLSCNLKDMQLMVETGSRSKRKRQKVTTVPDYVYNSCASEKLGKGHSFVLFPGCVDGGPLLHNGDVYCGCQGGGIMRIRADASGLETIGAYSTDRGWRIQAKLVVCSVGIIACCHHASKDEGCVICLDESLETVLWEKILQQGVKATPRLHNNFLLVQSGSTLFGLNIKNGEILAELVLPGKSVTRPCSLTGKPPAALLYTFDDWDCGYALVQVNSVSAITCRKIGGLHTPIRADPIKLDSDRVFVADILGAIHVINVASGSLTTSSIANAAFSSSPTTNAGGDILLGCNDGVLRCLSRIDPSVIVWSIDTKVAIVSSPLPSDHCKETCFVCNTSGEVLKVNCSDGTSRARRVALANGEVWSDPVLMQTQQEHDSSSQKSILLFGARDSGLHSVAV